MLTDLQFDPLTSGAYARRITVLPLLRKGEWNTLLDIEGPGMITHIWFTFPQKDTMLGRRNLLRIFWDDEDAPSVVAPLTDFFGIPFGFTGEEFQLNSRYLVVVPNNGLNCYFKMPFASRARMEIFPEQIESGGGFYFQADYYSFQGHAKGRQAEGRLPEACRFLRFHAQFRFEHPCENYGRNYLFVDAVGKGLFLGATFGVETNQPQADGWVHGGGDTFLIDGETQPSVLHGIGAEDFFGHSWGVRKSQSHAVGVPWHEMYENEEKDIRIALYRFFVDDPIPFRSSIRGILGALSNNYSSVAYWYQEEPHTAFFHVPKADDRMPHSKAPYGTYDIETAEPAAQVRTTLRQSASQQRVHGTAIEWKLLAPFRIDEQSPFNQSRIFETEETGSEEYLYQAEGHAVLPGGNEMKVRWVSQRACHGFIDFNLVARPALASIRLQTGVLGYALTYVESEIEKDVIMHVGFDDDISIRLNSDVVYTGSHIKGFQEAYFQAHLNAGRNRLLVKLSNEDNETWRFWGFSFRIENAGRKHPRRSK